MVVEMATVATHDESFTSELVFVAVQDVKHGLDEVFEVVLLLEMSGGLPQPRSPRLLVLVNWIH